MGVVIRPPPPRPAAFGNCSIMCRTRATISAGDESALDAQRDGDGPFRPALNGGGR